VEEQLEYKSLREEVAAPPTALLFLFFFSAYVDPTALALVFPRTDIFTQPFGRATSERPSKKIRKDDPRQTA